jgi:hypothetical protein
MTRSTSGSPAARAALPPSTARPGSRTDTAANAPPAIRSVSSPGARVSRTSGPTSSQKPTLPTSSQPSTPAPPEESRRNRWPCATAPPTPSPSHSRTKSARPAAAPSRCSTTAARFTSFSSRTLTPRSCSSSLRRRGRQPGTPLAPADSPEFGRTRPGAPRTTRRGRRAPAFCATGSTGARPSGCATASASEMLSTCATTSVRATASVNAATRSSSLSAGSNCRVTVPTVHRTLHGSRCRIRGRVLPRRLRSGTGQHQDQRRSGDAHVLQRELGLAKSGRDPLGLGAQLLHPYPHRDFMSVQQAAVARIRDLLQRSPSPSVPRSGRADPSAAGRRGRSRGVPGPTA